MDAEGSRKLWNDISVRADEAKDSQSAIPALYAAYRALGEHERLAVDAC